MSEPSPLTSLCRWKTDCLSKHLTLYILRLAQSRQNQNESALPFLKNHSQYSQLDCLKIKLLGFFILGLSPSKIFVLYFLFHRKPDFHTDLIWTTWSHKNTYLCATLFNVLYCTFCRTFKDKCLLSGAKTQVKYVNPGTFLLCRYRYILLCFYYVATETYCSGSEFKYLGSVPKS